VTDAEAMRASTGCAAVMIGRGALGRPWIFGGVELDRDARARIIRRHLDLMLAHLSPPIAHIQMKKHLAWYAVERPGMAQLRRQLFETREIAEVLDLFWSAW
jgi:tRNA-dihydrouridine synthase